MADNPPGTPGTPPQSIVVASNTADYTRSAEPPTPYNVQHAKRRRNVEFAPVPAPDLRKAAASKDTDRQNAQARLEARFQQMELALQVKKKVLATIGAALDKAVASFSGPHETSYRRECREQVDAVLDFLNAHAFTTDNGRQMAADSGRLPSSNEGGAPATRPSYASNASGPTQNASWATVASRNMPLPTKAALKPSNARKAPYGAQPRKDHEDLRVLVTLDHDERGASGGPPRQEAFVIRSAVVTALKLTARQLPDASVTRTGYALVAADAATRDLLLEPKNAEEILRICGGTTICRPEKWFRYAVKEVPYTFRRPDGALVDTRDVIEEEVVVQTGQPPCNVSESRYGADPLTGRGTFIVSFLRPVKAFRLFSTSEMSKLVNKKPQLRLHNPGCQGYCVGTKCKRVHRCERCGERKDRHTGPCEVPVRCANCCGPFQSGHEDCPARPTFQNGRWVPPGKKARVAIRAQGNRLYAEANPPEPEVVVLGTNTPRPPPPAAANGKRPRSPGPAAPPDAPPAAAAVAGVARELPQRRADTVHVQTTAPAAAAARSPRMPRTANSGPLNYNEANRFQALLNGSTTATPEGMVVDNE